jgi:AraC-like DNA-binding protein
MDRLIIGCQQGSDGLARIPTDVTSVSGLAQRLNLSRTQLGRKFAEAEAMGSLGWSGPRGKSPLWVSAAFRREYHAAQAVKLAIVDAAFEACVTHSEHADREPTPA